MHRLVGVLTHLLGKRAFSTWGAAENVVTTQRGHKGYTNRFRASDTVNLIKEGRKDGDLERAGKKEQVAGKGK